MKSFIIKRRQYNKLKCLTDIDINIKRRQTRVGGGGERKLSYLTKISLTQSPNQKLLPF